MPRTLHPHSIQYLFDAKFSSLLEEEAWAKLEETP
jgi:hypothetical protein